MSLRLRPITQRAAFAFIAEKHRHHLPPRGAKFCIGVDDDNGLVGVATAGRPVARAFDDGYTIEVSRCCTDSTPFAASKLYAACWRAARAMGYTRLITYTLAREPGTSLVAAGYRVVYQTQDRPKGWDTPSRRRIVKAPTEAKTLWEVTA